MHKERNQTIRDTPSIGKFDTKLKCLIPLSPLAVKDISLIDLYEVRDINFSSTMNDLAEDDQSMFKEINVELLDVDVSESVHSFIVAPAIKVDLNGSSLAVQYIESGVHRDNRSTNQQDSIPESSFGDTMVPRDVAPEEGNNLAREKWLGGEFPNREAFRRVIAKYAIYNNFTMEH